MLGASLSLDGLTWHLTQYNGQGLDHSIVHKKYSQCNINALNMTSQGATRCGRKILDIYGFWSSEVCAMLFQACIELRLWKFNFNTEVRGCRYESTQSSKERLGVDMIEFTIITIQQVVMFSYNKIFSYSGKAWKNIIKTVWFLL
jgi:hypothetical protein